MENRNSGFDTCGVFYSFCLKGINTAQTSVLDVNAVGLGAKSLYDAYFVCVTISGKRTIIEYGKIKDTRDSGDVFLTMVDRTRNFDIRFYAFENGGDLARIIDAHIVSRKRFEMTCRGNTVQDAEMNLCAEGCHWTCDPFESRLFLSSVRGALSVVLITEHIIVLKGRTII